MPLEARFFGRYEHSLDVKGRLILPAKHRAHFNQPGFLTPHLEGCLALWTALEFEKEIEVRLAAAEQDPISRNAVRDWSSQVNEVEIDRQGRMAIPLELRRYAALEQGVLVIGMINRVELWSPTVWENRDDSTSSPSAS